MMRRFWVGIFLLAAAVGGRSEAAAGDLEQRLKVPDGFSWTIYASGIKNARKMQFTETGALLVTTPSQDKVLLLEPDRNGDGASDGRRTLLDGLDGPHGVEVGGDALFVAETQALRRYPFNGKTGQITGQGVKILDLPSAKGHWTRTVRLGADGWLYVTAGSSCNVCIEQDQRRAAMLRVRPDGSAWEIYATGLRNTVGFDWAPRDGALYGVDNGRDWLGDDFPPCELNRIVKGGFYGWPYANGNRVADPDYGAKAPQKVAESLPPAHGFGAHVAPLGLAFLAKATLPRGFERAALATLHGSWNRSKKAGYKVVSLHWRDDGSIVERDFMTGFLDGQKTHGRPVDVIVGPDGAIYVSDDYAGNIYRIAYRASR